MVQALFRRGRALAVAYLSQNVVVMCGWAFPLILNRFWKYEAVLYCALLGLSFVTFPVHRLTISFRRTVLWGAIIGYVAGLITGNLTPLFEGRHFHDLLNTWRILGVDVFMEPVIIFSWLVGICFGLALLAQERMILARQTEELVNKLAALGIAGPPIP